MTDASADAIFLRDGDHYLPTPLAKSPWSSTGLHGGPPAGLFAHVAERHVSDASYQCSRLTVDLFRMVPDAPLHVAVTPAREGRRIRVLNLAMTAGGVTVAQASALFELRSDAPDDAIYAGEPGPDGFATRQGLMRPNANRPPSLLPGFHTAVEARWVSEPGGTPTVWMRIPVPFIGGEETTPTVRAAALSDFGNALANQIDEQEARRSYINSDITLYMSRPPQGEWLCLRTHFRDDKRGVGFVESIWSDHLGRYGRAVQARLANDREVPTAPPTA